MIYPTDIEALRAALLDAFDRQRQVDIAARLVARHHTRPPAAGAYRHARRDAVARGLGFSRLSDVGGRGASVRGGATPARHILLAVARYLAALSPTERDIALRLMRGGELHPQATRVRILPLASALTIGNACDENAHFH
jgi:hypothetical protein